MMKPHGIDPIIPSMKLICVLFQVMFEHYGFDAVYVAIQAVLTLYAQGLLTGRGCFYFVDLVDLPDTICYIYLCIQVEGIYEYHLSTWYQSNGLGRVIKDD